VCQEIVIEEDQDIEMAAMPQDSVALPSQAPLRKKAGRDPFIELYAGYVARACRANHELVRRSRLAPYATDDRSE